MVEVGIHAVISDEEVGPSVIVVIGGCHREILALRLVDTCRRSHVAECAVSVVVVKNCGRTLVNAGRTIRVHVDKVAVARARCVHRDIAAYVQIQTAVAVIVEESSASMKRSSGFYPRDSGFVRNVGKRAVAIVAIEHVAAELGYIEVGKAVVVIVSPDAAQAVACAGDPGLVGYISKGAIAIVVIQRIACRNAAIVEIAVVDKIDVLPAVSVEIRHRKSGAEDFADDGHPLVSRIVYELDAGGCRGVRELNGWRRGALCVNVRKADGSLEDKQERQPSERGKTKEIKAEWIAAAHSERAPAHYLGGSGASAPGRADCFKRASAALRRTWSRFSALCLCKAASRFASSRLPTPL